MSTPLSFITMKKEQGYKLADKFLDYKTDTEKPLAAILSLNTIANTIGAAGVGRQATIIFGSTWFGIISAIMTLLIRDRTKNHRNLILETFDGLRDKDDLASDRLDVSFGALGQPCRQDSLQG